MASLNITGIRICHVWVGREDSEDAKEKVTAAYRLVTDKGNTVGSKETLTSESRYGSETVFVPSQATMKLLRDAVAAYRKEVEDSIGLGAQS